MAESSLQELVACLGQPVSGNPTQYMMERAFAKAGLDWRYLTCEVPPESLGEAVRGLRALGFRGANFTIPHKVAVLEHLDQLSPAAELMGAVNCMVREDGRLLGENTDGKGFVESLRTVCDPTGKSVAVLGAGGAARAIAVELGLSGAGKIVIVNRSTERGEALARLLAEKVNVSAEFVPWQGDYVVPADIDILVQATSIGLGDAEARVPLDADTLRPGLIVADVVFNPPRTRLLRIAAEHGCVTLDGLGMLINQGVIAFRIWTGVEPDPQVMREALEEYLEL